MLKHTPGPWKIIGPKQNKDSDGVASTDCAIECAPGGPGTGSIIAECFGRTGENVFHDAVANATLIANAPDMLAAIKQTIEYCNDSGNWFPYINEMRAVLAKAEGKSVEKKS